ncbi:MAG: hypothetical protein H3C27_15325 [Opitutaceae bacterium]|nr:hypothetical protein [Opitutaceae bacterium]
MFFERLTAEPSGQSTTRAGLRENADVPSRVAHPRRWAEAMSLFQKLKSMFGDPAKEAQEPAGEPTSFIYVKIPDGIGPIDRGDKYEDPLEEKLSAASLGHVTGGGSQLGDPRPDGSRPIEFCGLDIDATDLVRALALLRAELPSLGAPDGTELHYTVGDTRLQDVYSRGQWTLEQPRTFLHPGFGT